jgi:uncharacterized protein YaiI (UPF0178 family)
MRFGSSLGFAIWYHHSLSFALSTKTMKIWVDADACPVAVKEIIFRAADRTGIETTLVANQYIRTPPSKYIKLLQVPRGFDEADDEIVRRVEAGNLVITSDIPLAAQLVDKGAQVLSPRGELFSAENIKALHTMRDFMDTMRASGIDTGGPPAYSQADRKTFASQFDRIIAKFPKVV